MAGSLSVGRWTAITLTVRVNSAVLEISDLVHRFGAAALVRGGGRLSWGTALWLREV